MNMSDDFDRNAFDSFGNNQCGDEEATFGRQRPSDGACYCREGMKEVLEAIIHAVNRMNVPGFAVTLEITMKNGILYTVNIASGVQEPARIRGTLLMTDDLAISICDIAKIHILSAQSDPSFTTMLERALRRICYGGNGPCPPCPPPCPPCPSPCRPYEQAGELQYCGDQPIPWGAPQQEESRCETGGDREDTCEEECAKDLERFIQRNLDDVQNISFNGSMSTIQSISAINEITYTDAIETANLTTVPASVVQGVTLSQTPASVVGAVAPTNTTVVTNVSTTPQSLVTGITTQTASVAGAITTAPLPVVNAVNTTLAPDGVVTGITETTQAVIGSLTTTPATAVTGFGAPTVYGGVITGVDVISSIAPQAVTVPVLTSVGTGLLQITIAANSLGAGIPPADVTLNVQAGGSNVTFGGNITANTLPTTANVLGGLTATPAIETISVPGAPVTAAVIGSVTPTPATVIGSITPSTLAGSLVSGVETATINNVTVGPATEVVSSVAATTGTVNVPGPVSTVPASSLFTTTPASVVGTAVLNTTPTSVVGSATLNTTSETVVESVNAAAINVLAPTVEAVDGSVAQACEGIMAVDNTNGDMTVYSICEINAVNIL